MSKKYQERLLHASGVSSKSFSSAFGSKILQKFGWKEGAGLGAEEEGRTDCVQVQRREQQVGLGAEKDKKAGDDWNDWWSDVYNAASKGMQVNNDKNSKITVDDSSDSSDSEDDNAGGRKSCIKGARFQIGKLRRVLRQEAPAAPIEKSPSPAKAAVSPVVEEKPKKEKKEKRASEETETAEDEEKKAKKEKKEKKRKEREEAEAAEAAASEPEKKKKKKKEKKEKKASEDEA